MPDDFVKFRKISDEDFEELTTSYDTFYRVFDEQDTTEELYIGDKKLTNQSPFSLDQQGYISCDYSGVN